MGTCGTLLRDFDQRLRMPDLNCLTNFPSTKTLLSCKSIIEYCSMLIRHFSHEKEKWLDK